MHKYLEKNVSIVAHDAGAANHIASWLKTGYLDVNKVALYVEGPAIKIFQNIAVKQRCYSIEQVFNNADLLISGTGWASTLEHNARNLALKKNIKSVAVIEHWTNYRERFIRENKKILPDEIWVTDEYALELAEKKISNVKVVLHRNDYIALQVEKIKNMGNNQEDTSNILLVMEPIFKKWGDSNVAGEFQSLEYFFNNISKLKLGNKIKIIIRPHPAEEEGKYEPWIAKHSDLPIKVNYSSSLAELIAWANVVVGMQTYAMVIALFAGKKVFSSIPPHGPKCILPHKDIVHFSSYLD